MIEIIITSFFYLSRIAGIEPMFFENRIPLGFKHIIVCIESLFQAKAWFIIIDQFLNKSFVHKNYLFINLCKCKTCACFNICMSSKDHESSKFVIGTPFTL